MKALRRFTVRAHLPERLAALEQLSINLRWSWDKPTQDLFEAIDPTLWTRLASVKTTAFFNVYGPTECTVDSTAARIDGKHAPHIGTP